MLNFKKLTLDDIDKLRAYFQYSENKTCDNTVGCTFMWREYFSTEYALSGGTLLFKVKHYDGVTAFTYPLGEDIPAALDEIEHYCITEQIPPVFCTITQNELPVIKTLYSNTKVRQESSWSDYLYNAQDLVDLSGKRFHGQRNHINGFKRAYTNYCFEVISDENISDVIEFFEHYKATQTKDTGLYRQEQENALEVLKNFAHYGLLGGAIRVDGKVAAFAVGEKCRDVLFIHIEKADIKYRGIYPLINNEFAKYYVSDEIKFINREEDDGDTGLRISKQSYHPIELIEKFVVEVTL